MNMIQKGGLEVIRKGGRLEFYDTEMSRERPAFVVGVSEAKDAVRNISVDRALVKGFVLITSKGHLRFRVERARLLVGFDGHIGGFYYHPMSRSDIQDLFDFLKA